jgi:hypothetical protein
VGGPKKLSGAGLPIASDLARRLRRNAERLLGRDPVVLVSGKDGAQRLPSWDAVCMAGECGGDQLAFSIQPRDPKSWGDPWGTVIPRAVVGPDRALLFGKGSICPGFREPETKGPWCYEWRTSDSSLRLELRCRYEARPREDGNGGADVFCRDRHWRLEALSAGPLQLSTWTSAGDGAGRPDPLALLLAPDGGYRIVWTARDPPCCPDHSQIWMTRRREPNGEFEIGRHYPAGRGQPCD